MASEILDIIVRQKGARTVARDIGQIGAAANSSRNALRGFQTSLNRVQTTMGSTAAKTNAATGAVRGLTTASMGARRSLTALGTGVALVGGALTAALVKPLKGAIVSAADFQRAMNLTGVLANVNKTDAAFNKLSDEAKRLGLTTQFTATQAAEGMQYLAKAGFDAEEVFKATAPALNLAAAANVDMATAADLATNIIKGYRQEVEDLPAAIDIMAAAFTSSNTDILELAAAFEKVGPVAVEFQQKFQDTAAVVAALANAGIKAQSAGVALRRIIINLQKDSASSNSVLRELGVTIFEIGDDGQRRLRPIQDIFIDIANSNATAAQKIDLFGARALAAGGIISSASADLEAYADAISNQVGRAAEIGAARLEGFWGTSIQLKSALEGLGIAIAESGLLDFLTKLVQLATQAVRAIEKLPKPFKAAIGIFASVAALLSALILKFGLLLIAVTVLRQAGIARLIPILGQAGAALKAFSLFFVTNPVGIFILAIGAAIAILYHFRNETIVWGDQVFTVGDLVVATWDWIVDSVKYAWDYWGKFFSDVGKWIGSFKIDMKTVLNFVKALVNAMIGLVIAVGYAVVDTFKLVAAPLATFISSVVDSIKNIPKLVKSGFKGEDILDTITKPFTDAWEETKSQTQSFVGDMKFILQQDYLGNAADGLLTVLDQLDITDRAAERYQRRLLERQRAKKPEQKKPPGRGAPGTPTPAGLAAEEIKKRAEEYLELIKSLLQLTSAEEKLRAANVTLTKAQEANIVTAEQSAVIYKYLAGQVYAELERDIYPVNAAIKDQSDKLRELEVVGKAAGISSEQLAKAQSKVRENFEKSVIALEDFQKGLSATESVQYGLIEGVNKFGESLGTTFSNIADLVQGTLDKSLDAIHEFVTTGKFDFRQFALDVIADIQKVVLKLIALQALGSFQARGEFGGGLGGFAKAFVQKDVTGFERFKLPGIEEKAKGMAGLGVDVGTAANPIYTLASNPSDKPLATTLTDPESPAIVSLRDAITASVNKASTLQLDKTTETNSILNAMLTQMGGGIGLGATGAAGGPSIVDNISAVNGVERTTGMGLENVVDTSKANTDQFCSTTDMNFDSLIGQNASGFRSIVSALAQGTMGKASAAYQAVSIAAKLVGSFAGGGGGAGAAAGAAGTIAGGAASSRVETIMPGAQSGARIGAAQIRQPFLVGERGPEIFAPGQRGAILPNGMLEAMNRPPELKVTVVNVDDPKSVPQAIGTQEGESAVLNIIQRNRGRLRELLA